MASKPRTFTYQPTDGLFVPDLKPGATVEARSEGHAAQLEAHPCFRPVQTKRTTKSDAAASEAGDTARED